MGNWTCGLTLGTTFQPKGKARAAEGTDYAMPNGFAMSLRQKTRSELQPLSPDIRSHAMKSLASLSKFLGLYDDWLGVIGKQVKVVKPWERC